MEQMHAAHFADQSEPRTLFKMLLCPSAKKTAAQGGENPYMAWVSGDYVLSYGINLWISNETGSQKGVSDGFWQHLNQRHISYAPIIMDAQWKDADPIASDDPPEHEYDHWTPGAQEMRRFCFKRHGRYNVNGLFGDCSVKTYTIKELWMIQWHREWPAGFAHLPVWSLYPWMDDVPDPAVTWYD
jgi:hypothetical protein